MTKTVIFKVTYIYLGSSFDSVNSKIRTLFKFTINCFN